MALCPGGKLRSWAGDGKSGYHFWCPGCKEVHGVTTGPSGWTFNGNTERPTFGPSILVRGGHYADDWKPGDPCWCTFNKEHADNPFTCTRCHSYVEDGRIRFLSDCSHELAGQTVDLPAYPHGEE